MISTNITAFRKNVFSMLEQTIQYNEPLNISTKAGNAVVLSEADYQGMMETLYLVSQPGMREQLLEGKNTPLSECLPEREVELGVYEIVYTRTAAKDIPKLKAAHLDDKAKQLISILKQNPYQSPPSYEKLTGDLQGLYSRRINVQHRLVYEVLEDAKTVKIVSLWTHYDKV